MNCLVCNGVLKYDNGLYICQNCGNKQQISTFFENIEVFICYIENDSHGRRTKDSVIAQEIYNSLQTNNINTFYQRISAEDLNGSENRKACMISFDKAKILVLLGTNKEYYDNLINEYKDSFASKVIIPVYSGINAYDLPIEVSNLQAINYDNIGASVDITKNILHRLGRNTEVDIASIAEEITKKNKKNILLTAGIMGILVIIIAGYIVLGTHYVLDSKKYDYAQKLETDGNYVDAIKIYSNLDEYKNSRNIIDRLYNKYEGNYNSNDKSFSVRLTIDDNFLAKIEIIFFQEKNKQIKATTEAQIKNNILAFYFTDNQNVNGHGNIVLCNDGLQVEIKSKQMTQQERTYYFKFSEKEDAPLFPTISKEKILKWLNIGVTKTDIIQDGYEINIIERLGHIEQWFLCEIENTDIKVVFSLDDVVGFSMPAQIIYPDKIGTLGKIINKNDILYIPNGKWEEGGLHSGKYDAIINKDTEIAVTSKTLHEIAHKGYYPWEEYLENLLEINLEIKYRVRKSADDASSQIGAFAELGNAIIEADNYKSEGYKVYDEYGDVIYTP